VISNSTCATGLLYVTLLTLLLFSNGCGSDRPYHAVSGKVQFKKDDSFAHFGSVEFRSESEPIITARGKIEKDGTFTLNSTRQTGTVGGWHTVVIMQPVSRFHGKVVHNHGLEAARKYLDHRTTDLRIEVTSDPDDDAYIFRIDHWDE